MKAKFVLLLTFFFIFYAVIFYVCYQFKNGIFFFPLGAALLALAWIYVFIIWENMIKGVYKENNQDWRKERQSVNYLAYVLRTFPNLSFTAIVFVLAVSHLIYLMFTVILEHGYSIADFLGYAAPELLILGGLAVREVFDLKKSNIIGNQNGQIGYARNALVSFNNWKMINIFQVGSKEREDSLSPMNPMVHYHDTQTINDITGTINQERHFFCYSQKFDDSLCRTDNISIEIDDKVYRRTRVAMRREYKKYIRFLRALWSSAKSAESLFFNEDKLCMNGISFRSTEIERVYCHKGEYYDTCLTNYMYGKSLVEIKSGNILATDDSLELTLDKDAALKIVVGNYDSGRNNELGISTLGLFIKKTEQGYTFSCAVNRQSKNANSSQDLLAPTGSGGADFEDYSRMISSKPERDVNFLTVIASGMEREFIEENFKTRSAVSYIVAINTKVIGHFRWLNRGSKPEFVGITGALVKQDFDIRRHLEAEAELDEKGRVIIEIENLKTTDKMEVITKHVCEQLGIPAVCVDPNNNIGVGSTSTCEKLHELSMPLFYNLMSMNIYFAELTVGEFMEKLALSRN